MSEAPGQHYVVAAWDHAALGRFEVHLDLDLGVTIQLELESAVVVITVPGGLAITLPGILPDLLVHELVVDLRSAALQVDATPSLGAFEDHVLSLLLRATLLRGLDADGLHPLAALDSFERDDDDTIVLYQAKLVRVLTAPASALSLHIRGTGVELTPSASIALDFGPLLGRTAITSLVWDFASASLRPVIEGTVSLWDRVVERVLPIVARAYLSEQIPPAMRRRGYDPRSDAQLPAHVRQLLLGVAGEADETGSASQPETHAGDPHLGFDPGDTLQLGRLGPILSARCESGFFISVPNHPWTRALRWREVRFDLKDSTVTIDSEHAVGAAATQGIAAFVNQHLAAPVRRTFASLERDTSGRYLVAVEGATLHLPGDGFTLSLSSKGLSIELLRSALVTAQPRVFRYAVRAVRYTFADGDVDVVMRGTNCIARLATWLARRRLAAGLAAFLASRLPDRMRTASYDLSDDPHQLANLAAIFSGDGDAAQPGASAAATGG